MNISKCMEKSLRSKKKVLFADLDGTIITTKSGKTFPVDTNDWKFKERIVDAVRKYNPTHLHIVSNQGGIEKGFVNRFEFVLKMNMIQKQLRMVLPKTGITCDFCSSNDPDNKMRKPNCGMIDTYCTDYCRETNCDKRYCLMIGDASGKLGQFSDSDKKCAENAGIRYLDIDDFIKAMED